jgi:phosphatidate cytidylyltransferase
MIIAALLVVLYLPPIAFALAMGLVLLLAWHEFGVLCQKLGVAVAMAPGALIALGTALTFAAGPQTATIAILLAIPALALATLRDHTKDPAGLAGATAAGLAGLAWLALPLGAQIGIRHETNGAVWLLFLYAAVAVGDSAAFYGGTRFGKNRLAPELSPKKSIEGSVFGVVGSALGGALAAHWLPDLSYGAGAGVAAILGLVGQAGDLIESALKRTAGQKDSSGLLPGHGGVLDRIDAHLPAGAVLYAALRAGWLG